MDTQLLNVESLAFSDVVDGLTLHPGRLKHCRTVRVLRDRPGLVSLSRSAIVSEGDMCL